MKQSNPKEALDRERVNIGMSLWNSEEYEGGTLRVWPVTSRAAGTKCKYGNCRNQKYFAMLEVWQIGTYTRPVIFPFKVM